MVAGVAEEAEQTIGKAPALERATDHPSQPPTVAGAEQQRQHAWTMQHVRPSRSEAPCCAGSSCSGNGVCPAHHPVECPDTTAMLWQVLLPAMRIFLKPSQARATDGTIIELTRLEKLYRVFERC